MRRFTLALLVFALGLAVACSGGGDDDGNGATGGEASPAASAASDADGSDREADNKPEPSGGGADSNFCAPGQTGSVFDGFDFTTGTDLEARLGAIGGTLDGWVDSAPSEIRDDARVAAKVMGGLIELLEEYEYDVFAMAGAAAGDARVAALESGEFNAAIERLSAYCGIDVETPALAGEVSDGYGTFDPTFSEGELPEDFPEELVPPASEIGLTADVGLGATVEFTSTATLEEISKFYGDLLGDPTFSDGESTLWSTFAANAATTVTVSGSDGDLVVIVVVVTGG